MSKRGWRLAIACVVAAVLGFVGAALTSADAPRLLFCAFLVLFVAVLLIALLGPFTTTDNRG